MSFFDNTDIGRVIIDGGFGWWCEKNDADEFFECIRYVNNKVFDDMGENGFFHLKNYDVR